MALKDKVTVSLWVNPNSFGNFCELLGIIENLSMEFLKDKGYKTENKFEYSTSQYSHWINVNLSLDLYVNLEVNRAHNMESHIKFN